jgi:hypothetical protein
MKDHMEDFLVLMQNYGKATDYTNVALQSSGAAMDKFSDYEQSVESKTKTLQASLQELASDTLNSGVIKGFLDLSAFLFFSRYVLPFEPRRNKLRCTFTSNSSSCSHNAYLKLSLSWRE